MRQASGNHYSPDYKIYVSWGGGTKPGFVAVQPRNGTITIPAEARRALRLDLPGAQVEVILRDQDLVLAAACAPSGWSGSATTAPRQPRQRLERWTPSAAEDLYRGRQPS
jgi:bifunctional DNA-binding transcriptional regulator/antitoxin component of YhaV-PrlF toxin-antitoxin module